MPTSSATPTQSSRARSFSRKTRGIHPFLKEVRSIYRAQHRKPQYEAGCVQWIEQFLRAHPDVPIRRLRRRHAREFLTDQAYRSEIGRREEREAREALHFLWTEVLPRLRG